MWEYLQKKYDIFSQISTAKAPMTFLFELIEQIDTKSFSKWMIFFVEKNFSLAEPPSFVPLVKTHRGLGLVAKLKDCATKKI